jgi:hypothetical protein
MALADFIEETGIPAIAYHHDSYRNRSRFCWHNSVLISQMDLTDLPR